MSKRVFMAIPVGVVAMMALPIQGAAQSPPLVKYCQDLTATYRKAIADGKPPVSRAGQAIADCPTNPNGSINVLEGVLKELDVKPPART